MPEYQGTPQKNLTKLKKQTLTQPFSQTRCRYFVFIGNFEQISDLGLVSPYLTLNSQILTG